MKYIAAILILWSGLYILSFARYNLSRKNKKAVAGSMILVFLIVSIPLIVMFLKAKERGYL